MSDTLQQQGAAAAGNSRREERKIIFASSLGTVFEWYDFFLYGALAVVISKQFFAGVNDTTAFIFALMAFAAGFNSLSAFYSCFRQHTGQSPKAYAKQISLRARAQDKP